MNDFRIISFCLQFLYKGEFVDPAKKLCQNDLSHSSSEINHLCSPSFATYAVSFTLSPIRTESPDFIVLPRESETKNLAVADFLSPRSFRFTLEKLNIKHFQKT